MKPCLILRVRAGYCFGYHINSWETEVIFHSREIEAVLEKCKDISLADWKVAAATSYALISQDCLLNGCT